MERFATHRHNFPSQVHPQVFSIASNAISLWIDIDFVKDLLQNRSHFFKSIDPKKYFKVQRKESHSSMTLKIRHE